MSDKRQWIPLGGLLATMAIVIYTVIQIHAQETGAVTGDFTNAAVAEVRDAKGAGHPSRQLRAGRRGRR